MEPKSIIDRFVNIQTLKDFHLFLLDLREQKRNINMQKFPNILDPTYDYESNRIFMERENIEFIIESAENRIRQLEKSIALDSVKPDQVIAG